MGELYGDRTERLLPLADACSIDKVADAMRCGGLADVTVAAPDEFSSDRAHGVVAADRASGPRIR